MGNTKRIGLIIALALAIVLITSLGGSHGVKPIQIAHAQDPGYCTGCSTDMYCYQCHVMNYFNGGEGGWGDCVACSGYYPNGLSVEKTIRDSVTGGRLKMIRGFTKIPMPKDHAAKVLEFHKRPNTCQKKLVTQ